MTEPASIERTLELAREGLAPSPGERQRLRSALATSGRAPAGSAGMPAAEPIRGWPALKASGKSGLALGATLVAVGFVAGLWFERGRAPLPPPAASERMSPAPLEAPAPASPVPASSADAPPAATPALARAAKPRARPAGPHGSKSDAFERELALVQRAERAIRNEDPALALALLGELDRQHPQAALAEERAAARVMANCQAHEPNAGLAAERFLRDAPSSLYTDRVRALCGSAPAGD